MVLQDIRQLGSQIKLLCEQIRHLDVQIEILQETVDELSAQFQLHKRLAEVEQSLPNGKRARR